MLLFHVFSELLPLEAIFSYDGNPVKNDWNAKSLSREGSLSGEVVFYLAKIPQGLIFAAIVNSPVVNPAYATKGECVEGLWNYDVVELFLRPAGQSTYWEVNLASTGAYWREQFESYRKPKGDKKLPRVTDVYVDVQSNFWRAALCLEFNEAPKLFEVHCCAILGEKHNRKYISSKPILGIGPDFHRAECFSMLKIINH